MHRLIWFDQQIKNNRFPNRNHLSEKFEISIRQCQRDIDYLRNSLGAPLKYDNKRKGYYYEVKNYTLPNVYINEIQRAMLKFLAYRYGNFTQTPKVVELANLFNRLAQGEDYDDEIPIFDLDKPIVQCYYQVYNAMISKNKIDLFYKDAVKGKVKMKLSPYKLFYKCRVDHLIAYDDYEDEVICIRLDRIINLEVSKDKFSIPKDIKYKKYSSFINREPFVAKVLFHNGCNIEQEEGLNIEKEEGNVYCIEFFNIDEFINKLICTRAWDKIISPKWLKQKIENRCKEIILKIEDRENEE